MTEIIFENYRGTNPKSIFDAMREEIFEQLQKLIDVEGSGWVLTSIDTVNVLLFEITDLVGGSSYKPVPKELVNIRDGIVNVDNRNDMQQQCFPISVARYLNPMKKKCKAGKLTKTLKKQVERLNLRGLTFPTPMSQISVF